jgi:hypothetical protein
LNLFWWRVERRSGDILGGGTQAIKVWEPLVHINTDITVKRMKKWEDF